MQRRQIIDKLKMHTIARKESTTKQINRIIAKALNASHRAASASTVTVKCPDSGKNSFVSGIEALDPNTRSGSEREN